MLVRPLEHMIKEQPINNLLTMKYLRQLDITEQVNILDFSGIYGIYQSKNYIRVKEYVKEDLFNEYQKKWSINLIVLTEELFNDFRFYSDPEWIHFINNPNEFGFAVIEIPDVKGIKLLIKKDILNK